jgi:hypothetical protein
MRLDPERLRALDAIHALSAENDLITVQGGAFWQQREAN